MRLFVALNLPLAERERLVAATAALRARALPVRWLDAAAWHLTLTFLGEVAAARTAELVGALEAVGEGTAIITLRLRGAGAFPSVRRPAVWWIGVEASEPLHTLQRAVDAALAPLGFPAEGRPFAPHITLGRTRRDAPPGALREAETWLHDVAHDGTITVDAMDLMQSHLDARGARYERLHAAWFRP